ncbi:MAG: hypothetical protein UV57_C0003G0016 [Parcubacteria group bacterium GW2011_GWD2_43_10]|uniref:O-antigen ligase-related domain-containing protein n=3 Tax=Candidatus Vebleniibacteriota TaxID=1817921 RepID=A0A1G2Q658_9BACT|nr:MAG: hypothetical protein UV52_C0010G0003 [Parcubacteria group bacterium GW2011_GWD1_42_9]KKS83982.1 MAG: hypothetical protein UV57_C0003G0016 [Parcubacteria group bacterium GW2011_GWD2_43_10]KKS94126.1 MAG: hypothetical protein UV69_C0001G0015 [Parcubacteria group bacterium GW2011_GWE2_43_12]KKT14029.1 MAG: hypothetical protein UV92_C0008G0020 [Parcubacteria group bacterium GW2011_GWA1_43_27]KKT15988.1 MAG: hypothetical protein UV96_C0007G0004 [Parcubacteria group bacterium GW2011_GWF2_43_3
MWLVLSPFSLLLPLAVLAWYSRRWALLVLLAGLSAYIIRTDLISLPTTWLELGIGITLAVWLIKGDWRIFQKINLRLFWPWLIPLLLWLVAGILGILVAEDTRLALGVWKGFIIDPLLLCIMVASVAVSEKEKNWWRDWIAALLVGAVATTTVAMLQTFTMHGGRLQSGYDSPNVLAMYLGPILIIGLLWLFENRRDLKLYQQLLWLGACLVVGWGVILTNSYTAIAAIMGAIVIYFIIKSWPKLAGVIGLVLILFSLLGPWAAVSLNKGLLTGHTNPTYGITSGEVRMILWRQAVEFIKASPILGLGLGQWQASFNTIAEERGWLSIKNPGLAIELHYSSLYPHNLWLTTWLSVGILGLVALIWLVIKVFKSAVGAAAIPAAVLAVQIIHGTLDTPMWKNDLAILWWLAIMFAIIYQLKLQPPKIEHRYE